MNSDTHNRTGAGERKRPRGKRARKRENRGGQPPKKASFLKNLASRARETVGLGHILATEPRAFPAALFKVVKRSVRTLWDARGGGFYATGFVLTFIGLNLKSLFDEIVSSTGVGAFIGEQVVQIFFRFTAEWLTNTIESFIWPVYLIAFLPPLGIALFVGLYIVFDRFINEPLEDWLFDDEEDAADSPAG